MENEKKSFKHRMAALFRKGKLSSAMLLSWLDREMSSFSAGHRYWIFVFNKPTSYIPERKEPKWLTQIRVWDSFEEKWINTIELNYYTRASTSFIKYDFEREFFMFVARSTIHWRAYFYSFFSPTPLASPVINYKEGMTLHWQTTDSYVMFNNGLGYWQGYNLKELKKGGIKGTHSYVVSEGMYKKEDMLKGLRFVVHANEHIALLFTKNDDAHHFAHICIRQGDSVSFEEHCYIPIMLNGGARPRIFLKDRLLTIGNSTIDLSWFA